MGKTKSRQHDGVTCIIPALNEEKTIEDVLKVVKKVPEVSEIIVIDDGSSDRTSEIAQVAGAKVIRHETNLGKGASMKEGARIAKNAYLVFIDADLQNLSPAKVRKLLDPLISGKADFVKASYNYAMGRVAKLVVKPLLKIVYPFIKLEHPLSGEVALDRRKFRFEHIEDGWGVDIQLVLQAARRKLRITEVSLGKKVHKHQNLDALSEMSEQIIRTILSELQIIAHRYQLIFFDLDKTLITKSSIQIFAKEWGFTQELKELQARVKKGEIPDKVITKTLVRHFKGKSQQDVDTICAQIPIHPFAAQVIAQLRKQRYRVRIVSAAYSPVVRSFAMRLNVHDFVCPRLRVGKNKRFTGTLKPSRFEDKSNTCCGMYVCKIKAVDYVRRRFGVKRRECMAIGDGKSDRCLFRACGLSLGYKNDIADVRIENLSEVLMHID